MPRHGAVNISPVLCKLLVINLSHLTRCAEERHRNSSRDRTYTRALEIHLDIYLPEKILTWNLFKTLTILTCYLYKKYLAVHHQTLTCWYLCPFRIREWDGPYCLTEDSASPRSRK